MEIDKQINKLINKYYKTNDNKIILNLINKKQVKIIKKRYFNDFDDKKQENKKIRK